jgi:hypothetical protein
MVNDFTQTAEQRKGKQERQEKEGGGGDGYMYRLVNELYRPKMLHARLCQDSGSFAALSLIVRQR